MVRQAKLFLCEKNLPPKGPTAVFSGQIGVTQSGRRLRCLPSTEKAGHEFLMARFSINP